MRISRTVSVALLVLAMLANAPAVFAQEEEPVLPGAQQTTSQVATQTAPAQTTEPPTPPAAPPNPAELALGKLLAWQRAEAETILVTIPETSRSLEISLARAMAKALDRDYEESLALLQQADLRASSDPAAPYYKGEILFMKRDNKGAAASWRMASQRATALVSENPKNASALYFLGASEVRMRKFESARLHLTEAKSAGYDPLLVSYQVGLSYAFQQKWTEAKEAFDGVLSQDQRFAHAYYYRALVWEKLKRKDQMFVDLDQFVKLAPTAPEADRAKALLATSKR